MNIAGLVPASRNVEGIVEMMLDATQNYTAPLTNVRLLGWHAALFSTGRSGMHTIVTGAYRNNAPYNSMLVVSGAMGKKKVHYEAPAAALLKKEINKFLKWYTGTEQTDAVLKAAIQWAWAKQVR